MFGAMEPHLAIKAEAAGNAGDRPMPVPKGAAGRADGLKNINKSDSYRFKAARENNRAPGIGRVGVAYAIRFFAFDEAATAHCGSNDNSRTRGST